jgi:predicted N-acyltransferase
MRIEVHDSIADLDSNEWNRLAKGPFPFISHEFLALAERTGCVSERTGWSPRHIGIYSASGSLVAAMPLYEKAHSWGEFVFDWNWAQAYQHAGLEYYPKLVSAAPFTPAPSSRLLTLDNNSELADELLKQAVKLANDGDLSSLHVLFPTPDELPALQKAGLKLRKDCQFHWHNHGYRNFDAFLETFSSSKRKKAKRDRRHVAEQGVTFRWLDGHTLDESVWRDVYQLISNTFLQRGSMPYYSLEFLIEVSARLPDSIQVVLALKDNETIATAVFYRGSDALYGRYWGCNTDINALHFETCYYQGIDFCIKHGISRFEPGTQGEHKISRGFTPVTTWSAHWLARPEFFSAIDQYLDREQDYIDRYIEAVNQHSPFKRSEPGK